MCSWDPKAAHDLPECMQYAIGKIMETYQTIDNELPQKDKYRMTYLKNFVSDLYHCMSHVMSIFFESIIKNYISMSIEQ
jgi:flagellar biosynthesis chaperone FliJ